MRTQLLSLTAALCVAAGGYQACWAGEKDKVYEVGKDGLTIKGELGKVSAVTYKVALESGKTYVIRMSSPSLKELNPLLVLLAPNNQKLGEGRSSRGDTYAQLIFRPRVGKDYQFVATSIGDGRGPFTLTVREGSDELALQRKALSPGHWKVVDLRLSISNVELLAGMDGRQQTLFNRAELLTRSASELLRAGKSGEALKAAQEAVDIRKELLGTKHRSYASSLNNLAFLYDQQRDHAKAAPLYQKALDIYKETLGEKHPSFADTLHNLGSCYYDQHNAYRFIRQAMKRAKSKNPRETGLADKTC